MIRTVFDYSRKIDTNEPILEYKFDEDLRRILASKIQFEEEESHFAPGPSVACRLRNDEGYEFLLIYLEYCDGLVIYPEEGADRAASIFQFMKELPELELHHLHTWT